MQTITVAQNSTPSTTAGSLPVWAPYTIGFVSGLAVAILAQFFGQLWSDYLTRKRNRDKVITEAHEQKVENKSMAKSLELEQAMIKISQNMLTKADLEQALKPTNDRLGSIDNRLDGIDNRLDGIDSRLDKVEFEQKKTNRKLNYLVKGMPEAAVFVEIDNEEPPAPNANQS